MRHQDLVGPAAARALDRRLGALPEPDAHTQVVVGELCAADDLDAAIARLRAAASPGDRVVFLEHVGRPGVAGRLEHAWGDAVAGFPWGCHVGRDVVAAFRRGGFTVAELERFTVPTLVLTLRSWVRGVAVAREVAE